MNTIRRLVRSGRAFEVTWRYLFNFAPTFSYRVQRSPLSAEASRILTNLNRDGVAITSAMSLFGPDPCFGDLSNAFAALQQTQKAALSLARANSHANEIAQKNFIYEYLG